jgi:Kef-type K+ transport system membrane component KefB
MIFQVLVSLAVLIFAAKLGGKVMHRIKQPVVLGEILAGMAISPFALGGCRSSTGSLSSSLTRPYSLSARFLR